MACVRAASEKAETRRSHSLRRRKRHGKRRGNSRCRGGFKRRRRRRFAEVRCVRREARQGNRTNRPNASATLYFEPETGRRRDTQDYQTLFAQKPGAVAAPTASLHFTPRLVAALAARGVLIQRVTLHVGPGTFSPVKAKDTVDHKMHAEWGEVSQAAADALNNARASGGRIVAAGTTSLRILEIGGRAGWKVRGFRRRNVDLHHAGL